MNLWTILRVLEVPKQQWQKPCMLYLESKVGKPLLDTVSPDMLLWSLSWPHFKWLRRRQMSNRMETHKSSLLELPSFYGSIPTEAVQCCKNIYLWQTQRVNHTMDTSFPFSESRRQRSVKSSFKHEAKKLIGEKSKKINLENTEHVFSLLKCS